MTQQLEPSQSEAKTPPPEVIEFKKLSKAGLDVNTVSELAILDSLRRSKISAEDVADIIRICNQPLVYKYVFKQLLLGQPYTQKTADYWIDNKGTKGWVTCAEYVYVIRNSAKKIVGSIKLEPNKTNSAEIGYWADSQEKGFITPAVLVLVEVAKKSGFDTLFGFIAKDNEKSRSVLEKAGFLVVDDNFECNDGKKYLKYEIILNDSH